MARFSSEIADGFTNPRNVGELALPDASARVVDPVCGDQIRLTVKIEAGQIADARFLAYGCAAALGTASILTSWIVGMTPAALLDIDAEAVTHRVGGLSPSQSHCATLAVEMLRALVADCPGCAR
jgi:nitrogen fixation NifU-like protein